MGFTNYAATHGLGTSGGEPTLGIDPRNGDVLAEANNETLLVRFDDTSSPSNASWNDVTDPLAAPVNLDPVLFTDTATGRTWAGGLEGECSDMAYTDDQGAHWTQMVNPCAPPGDDHPTIASGPWAGGEPTGASYPRAVYYCVHEAVEMCATSYDGGLTFHPAVPIATPALGVYGAGCGGYTGKARVASDGAVYVTSRDCGDLASDLSPPNATGQGVLVSLDNGLTWTGHLLPTIASNISPEFEPSVATTPSGWVYAAWTDVDKHVHVALSTDHGATWSPQHDVSPGLTGTVFSTVTAGDDDRAAVAFVGTADAGQPGSANFTGAWNLYVAYTLDGGSTWTTVKASPDPVERGGICTSGTLCTQGRNLLDFITAMTDAKGRVLVAYADGCPGGCPATSSSSAALLTIARQTCGPSLYAALGDVEGAAGCPDSTPATTPPPAVQTRPYTNPATDTYFGGPTFQVPPGSTEVTIHAVDTVDPHVGGEWCIDSCSGTIGFFCDDQVIQLPPGATTVIVSPNTMGFVGPFECTLEGTPGGVATTGTVTATFSGG